MTTTQSLLSELYSATMDNLHADSAEAEYYDAKFDGGEFSGPAHADMLEKCTTEIDAHFTALGAMFGISLADISDAWQRAQYDACYHV